MKTVFIFGAGASAAAGTPVMSSFLDRAYDLMRSGGQGIQAAKADFQLVFDTLATLRSVHDKSRLDFNNIEEIFGAFEMGVLLNRLGELRNDDVVKLRDSLIRVICKTIAYTTRFQTTAQRTLEPPRPYGGFVNRLKEAITHRNQKARTDPHDFSFITFNYDLCLDVTLLLHNWPIDYRLDGQSNGGLPLLKLHGSINWAVTQSGTIVPCKLPDGGTRFDSTRSTAYLDFDDIRAEKDSAGNVLRDLPVIIPPTWNKNEYHGQLSNVWAAAARELSEAENIIVIGYSFPESDSFFKYLYALGSDSPERVKRFVVVDKEESDAVVNRFKSLIGGGIERRFQVVKQPFDISIAEHVGRYDSPPGDLRAILNKL